MRRILNVDWRMGKSVRRTRKSLRRIANSGCRDLIFWGKCFWGGCGRAEQTLAHLPAGAGRAQVTATAWFGFWVSHIPGMDTGGRLGGPPYAVHHFAHAHAEGSANLDDQGTERYDANLPCFAQAGANRSVRLAVAGSEQQSQNQRSCRPQMPPDDNSDRLGWKGKRLPGVLL